MEARRYKRKRDALISSPSESTQDIAPGKLAGGEVDHLESFPKYDINRQ